MQLPIKHLFDKLGALVLLTLSSPFWFFIVLAIKIEDRGPVFFRQDRLGLHGEIFSIFKFRSMVVNADNLLQKDGSVKGVSRVTQVGKTIRKTSLDELPQLLNILIGDMSFIGPRPALPTHLPRYTEEQKGRLAMRPGITGLAQVKGRNTLPWSKRIKYDRFYIRKFSLLLDMRIALLTVRTLLTGEGVVLDRNPQDVDDLGPAP